MKNAKDAKKILQNAIVKSTSRFPFHRKTKLFEFPTPILWQLFLSINLLAACANIAYSTGSKRIHSPESIRSNQAMNLAVLLSTATESRRSKAGI